jgi:tetratricopeptide (TPR) repeat protein
MKKTIHKVGLGIAVLLFASYAAFSSAIFLDEDSGSSNAGWVPGSAPKASASAKGLGPGAQLTTVYAAITAHLEAGEFDRLIAVANDALAENPKAAQLHYLRGFARLQNKQLDEAIQDFSSALEITPDHADSYRFRAQAHMAKGQYDRALADADKGCEVDPQNAESYVVRAMAYVAKGDLQQAKPDVDQILKIDPKNAKAQILLAQIQAPPPTP